MTSDRFWSAVQRALDERLDPLDDDTVREHLAEHPDDLAHLLALERGLQRLAARHERAPDGARAWRRVAAALLVGVGLWAVGDGVLARWSERTAATSVPGSSDGAIPSTVANAAPGPAASTTSHGAASAAEHAPPASRPRGRVLDWTITASLITPDETRRVRTGPGFVRSEVQSTNSRNEASRTSWSQTWTRP